MLPLLLVTACVETQISVVGGSPNSQTPDEPAGEESEEESDDESGDVGAAPIVDPTLPKTKFVHDTAASALDPRSTTLNEPSRAILDNTKTQRGYLVLYMGGSGADPTDGDRKIAADVISAFGFHLLSLKYQNENPEGTNPLVPCVQNLGIACHEPYRLEILDGIDHSDYAAVPGPQNSILERARRQIDHLAKTYPKEGWGRYRLADGSINWSRTIVIGHSAGAAMAAFIGKRHLVHRAIMLSGPYDSSGGKPAAWVSAAASATPRDRFYGFTHEGDSQYAQHVENWEAMGLPTIKRVESLAGSLAPNRVFSSNLDKGGPAHNRTEPSYNSPKTNGVQDYLPVWAHLLGATP